MLDICTYFRVCGTVPISTMGLNHHLVGPFGPKKSLQDRNMVSTRVFISRKMEVNRNYQYTFFTT